MSSPPIASARTCVICDAPLLPHETTRTCGSPTCAWTLQTTPVHARCAVCERPLSPQQQAERVCANDVCRRTRFITQVREATRAERTAVEAEAIPRRDAHAAALGLDPRALPIAIVPSLDRPMTPLPADRRDAFIEYLAGQIATAFERGASTPSPDAPDPSPEFPPVYLAAFRGACATCRGACCTKGGTRAFLSVERMQRYIAEHPEQAPAEILAAYVAYLQSETIDGSCVYHGSAGCTLPREMRSDTCNRFNCGALYELRRFIPLDRPATVCLTAADNRHVSRTAVLSTDAEHATATLTT